MPALTRKRWLGILVLVVVIALGAWALRTAFKGKPTVAAAPDASNPGAGRPVPVIAGVVSQRDMPMNLDGLGSVIAFNTVTVKSRVDGQLIKVAFVEGQEVRKGDLLAELDPRPFEIALRQSSAALARDQAQLAQARLTLSRYRALRQENLIAQDLLDQQTATVAQLEATLQSDQSAVDNARLQLSYTRITSPLDGRTGLRLVDQGNMIHANDPNGLVVITALDRVAVLVTLPEDNLPLIAEQMAQHPLAADAYNRDGSLKLGTGEVALVDNQINPTAGTIKLKAIFPNPKRILWPNQFVKVRVMVSTYKNAIVVPATVVQRGPNGTFAYVIKADKTVETRPIEVGTTEGDVAVIRKGLRPGEQVVTEGQNKLRPGAKVSPKFADKVAQHAEGSGASSEQDAAGAPE